MNIFIIQINYQVLSKVIVFLGKENVQTLYCLQNMFKEPMIRLAVHVKTGDFIKEMNGLGNPHPLLVNIIDSIS